MTTSATVPPVEIVAPGLKTRTDPGTFAGAQKALLGVSVLALAASFVAWAFLGEAAKTQFYFSYLVAYLFVLSLILGSMFFVLVQHLARAGWSVVVRRVAENLMGTMPLMVPLFLPIAFGYHTLYHHWIDANPEDAVLAGKSAYLNVPFFFARAVLYFVIWNGIAIWFRRTSLRQDETGDPALTLRMARVAAPCMLLYALSLTFAAIDWVMALSPHWFSTMWGVYFFAGCYVGFMATLGLILMWLNGKGCLADAVTTEHYHDVGKLLFAFVVFWTYVAFSQYMLIWYANLPEETGWYHEHLQGSWNTVGELMMVGHFGIPFVFLMSRHIKRARATLAIAACFMLVMHWIDLYWNVMPHLHHEGPPASLHWIDFSTVIGLLCLVLCFFVSQVRRTPLLPLRDPRLEESLKFVNH